MNSTLFLVLRRHAGAADFSDPDLCRLHLGLTLIPGLDAEGQPTRMRFFHAFYFISYTATTIGFGEIPNAFSDAQRLWVTFCIYLSVIGWAYSIGALLALLQDQNFRNAVRAATFRARRCAICGNRFIWCAAMGKPGSLFAAPWTNSDLRAVVIELTTAGSANWTCRSFRRHPGAGRRRPAAGNPQAGRA